MFRHKLCLFLFFCFPFTENPSLLAENLPTHGLSRYGLPNLPENFSYLPYVNPEAPQTGTLRLAFLGTYDSLNPYNVKALTAAYGLIGQVFQSLLVRSLDEPFTLYGLLAKSIETDKDRTYILFHLNEKARFSDGKPVTAEDVQFSFNLLLEKGRPQQRDAFGKVRQVQIIDPTSIRFDLTGANDPELPLLLGFLPVFPRYATSAENFHEASLTPPIASGPYKVVKVRPGEQVIYRKDPNYWAKDLPATKGQYNFEEIIVDYYRDSNTLFEALKTEKVDYFIETNAARWLTGYDFPAVKEKRILKASFRNKLPKGLEGFAFNLRRPLFKDQRVRRALSAMFDFPWMNANILGGIFQRSDSFFADSELSYRGRGPSPEEEKLLQPFKPFVDPEVWAGKWPLPISDGSGRDRKLAAYALKLLEEAGFKEKDGRMIHPTTDQPLSFEIMVGNQNHERIALNYSQSLKRIGVEARVRLVDEVQYQRRRQNFDFDMMPGAWIATISPGVEQRSRWGSLSASVPSSFNLVGVTEEAVDSVLEALTAAKSQEEMINAARALDRLLISGFYVVPFFYTPDQYVAHSSKLSYPANVPLYGLPVTLWWQK